MKKLVSIVLALAMVLLCVGAAMADGVKIEISRDSSFDGADVNAAGNAYTWYSISPACTGLYTAHAPDKQEQYQVYEHSTADVGR